MRILIVDSREDSTREVNQITLAVSNGGPCGGNERTGYQGSGRPNIAARLVEPAIGGESNGQIGLRKTSDSIFLFILR